MNMKAISMLLATAVLFGVATSALSVNIKVPVGQPTLQAATDAAFNLRSGGGPRATTIDAQGVDLAVSCERGEGRDTVLDGLTLTGGDPVIFNGGGMYNFNLGFAGCGPGIPPPPPSSARLPTPGGPEGPPNRADDHRRKHPDTPGPAPSPPGRRIVAYTWEPVPEAADRLVYAVKVDRRQFDVEQVAAQLAAMPPGHRAIRLWKWAHPDLTRHPADLCRGPNAGTTGFWYPQPSAGLRVVRSRWEAFLDQLSAAGAPLDEVIVDFEAGYSMWAMKEGHPAAIMADPRWRGITSYEAGELKDISRILDYKHSPDYLLWNAAAHRIVDKALQRAIYEPLRHRYPACRCSNFDSFRLLGKHVVPSIIGAHPQWFESDGFGSHEGPSAYGVIGDYTAGYIQRGDGPVGSSAYSAFLYHIKRIEAVEASSTRRLNVWVCSRNQKTPKPRPVLGTPYNDEILRHMVVRRHGLVLWNAGMGGNEQEMMQTNAVIADAAVQIGETGDALPNVTGWSDTIVHSATTGLPDMADGSNRIIRRFTLEFPDQPLRYRINDVTFTRYAEEGEVGLWVSHEEDDDFELVGATTRFVVEGICD
ncbi:MAG: hypothetical protein ACYTGD_05685 [Planctomycetota bacterium]|jgi:hypothetical protein